MSGDNQSPVSAPASADRRHLGYAWMALATALVVHIVDEADHDFLGVYDQTSVVVRKWLPFLPWPTFGCWLMGLGITLLALFALSPWAFRAGRWMRRIAYVVSVLAALNALGHFASALHFNTAVPGTWSAMLLLLAAAMLFVAVRRATPNHHLPLSP